MNSGNHMVDGADKAIEDKSWKCADCGSKREPVDTGFCASDGGECLGACGDRIKQYQEDEMGAIAYFLAAIEKVLGIDPYYGIEINCPEYVDAVRCINCGSVTEL